MASVVPKNVHLGSLSANFHGALAS
jgi:hypothetical protein